MASVAELLAEQQMYYALRAGEHNAGAQEWYEPVLPEILKRLGQSGLDTEVLEIACGTGFLTEPLSKLAPWVYALDVLPEMLAQLAQRHLPNVTPITANVFDWHPWRRWKRICFFNFLAHIHPELLRSFFGTLDAALEPGGRVTFTDVTDGEQWNEDEVFEQDGVPLVRRPVAGRRLRVIRKFWDPDELMGLVNSWGWVGTYTVLGREVGRAVPYYDLGRLTDAA